MSTPHLIVCMGVSGAGKTTCAVALADSLNFRFIEADTFHSAANRRKMHAGVALTDADRAPWMRSIVQHLREQSRVGQNCVLAHSGLRSDHRRQLRHCGFRALFLHLDADVSTLRGRLDARSGHFMPSALLDSQLGSLQTTQGEGDVIRIDGALHKNEVLASALVATETFLTEEAGSAPASAH